MFCEKGKIVQQKRIYHGYQSKIKITSQSKLFKKNKTFFVGRYHSLKLYEPYNSKDIKITIERYFIVFFSTISLVCIFPFNKIKISLAP